ncbi:MAG: hypothetical protein N3B21_05135 [Clostridia bacterium]|nr:hypothetical protein [Clostridia bacterium]
MKAFNGVKKLARSNRGGIGEIIAVIVGIILVLGLIAYAVLGQVSGAKDTGDKALIEQDKVNQMLHDPNTVTGNIVKNYYGQRAQGGYVVSIFESNGTTPIAAANVDDGALFKVVKTYNANGKLATVVFTQVNLSR